MRLTQDGRYESWGGRASSADAEGTGELPKFFQIALSAIRIIRWSVEIVLGLRSGFTFKVLSMQCRAI